MASTNSYLLGVVEREKTKKETGMCVTKLMYLLCCGIVTSVSLLSSGTAASIKWEQVCHTSFTRLWWWIWWNCCLGWRTRLSINDTGAGNGFQWHHRGCAKTAAVILGGEAELGMAPSHGQRGLAKVCRLPRQLGTTWGYSPVGINSTYQRSGLR